MSSLIIPSRRGFLVGLGATIAAPFIVRAQSIMPVKSLPAEMVKNPARKWHHVDITRGDAMPVVLVDGKLIDPTRLVVSGWDIGIPDHKLLIAMPPRGSYQHMMLREHA
jgi:hypothetical protein